SGTMIKGTARAGQAAQSLPFVNLLRRDEGDVLAFRSADWFDEEGLPQEVFAGVDEEVAALSRSPGYYPAGLPALRVAIAAHMERLGLPTSCEQIMVTTGAQQAISLLVQLLVSPGVPVVVEQVTYPGALDSLRTAGAAIHGVPMMPTGVDVPALERAVARHRPALIYLVPGVHNPTG